MASKNIVLSIVIVNKNGDKYLDKCIRSVVEQPYEYKQIVVVDGGSTDNSVRIIRQYEKYLHYWVSEPDRGQSHAINKGMECCNGDYITYLNGDDMLQAGALSIIAEAAETVDSPHVIAGCCDIIDKNDIVVGKYSSKNFNSRIEMLTANGIWPQPGTFWTRGDVEFNECYRYCMDYDFWIRLEMLGYRQKILSDTLAMFRIHSESKGSNLEDVRVREKLNIMLRELIRLEKKSEAAMLMLYVQKYVYRVLAREKGDRDKNKIRLGIYVWRSNWYSIKASLNWLRRSD